MKEINKIGSVSPNKEHQSGIVVGRGGYYQHSIQYSGKNHLRQYGELVILGGIGDNERVNRDSKRVISGIGCMYALKAHIALEPPLVIRKCRNGQL